MAMANPAAVAVPAVVQVAVAPPPENAVGNQNAEVALVPPQIQILPRHSVLGANRFGPPYVCFSTDSDGLKCMKSILKLNGFKKHVNQKHGKNSQGCRCLSRFTSVGELGEHYEADDCK